MSDTDRAPDFELEEERRLIELDRLELEQNPHGRVLLHMANRLLVLSERITEHARDEDKRFKALERRIAQLEGEAEGNGAAVDG